MVAHVVTSVGWLGVSLALLVLALTGRSTQDAVLRQGAYRVMELLAGVLVPPLAVLALASGVALGALTRWGLVRHTWVLTKLVLTTGAIVLTLFVLQAQIAVAAAQATDPRDPAAAQRAGIALVVAGVVSVAIYVTATVLSVFTPWGLTRWGRRAARRPQNRPRPTTAGTVGA